MLDLYGRRRVLADLFADPAPMRAFVFDPDAIDTGYPGDITVEPRPVRDWLEHAERQWLHRVTWAELVGDDAVPYVSIQTHTGVFAAAFGCTIHPFEGSNAAAIPMVASAAEADRLGQPDIGFSALTRILEFADLVRERLGPDVPIGVPDIQSPFDIAALVWRKEDLYVAMKRDPEPVKALVAKCQLLLTEFLREFAGRNPAWNPIHCPYAWAPSALGCSLSEDEAGCMSVAMFEEFCLPSLVDLAVEFGGMFVHCCADADHQHASFKKIPGLRAMNRVFTRDPQQSIDDFAGNAALVVAWTGSDEAEGLLQSSAPNSRWLFNMPAQPLEDARRTLDRLRSVGVSARSRG